MDAKRCDRCGAFYVPAKKSTDVKTNLERFVATLNNKTQKHITDVCDLCPDCVGKFYEWLRSANKDGEKV